MNSIVHLNALRAINAFITYEGASFPEEQQEVDKLVYDTYLRMPNNLLSAILLRGLKSCSSNYKALSQSLMSIDRLITLDLASKTLPLDSPDRVVARLESLDGIVLLTDA